MSTPTRAGRQARPDFLSRFSTALPLLVVYFALAALYAWQASRRPVPTIFTDELELTQLSRSISETGEAARRGDPYGLATLVAYVLAPVWWLGSVASGYATAKVVLVLAMTATLFPAYGLARLVVRPWYALAAAGGSVAVPALAYAPFLVEEPLAYPLSTLALWLIARAVVRPGMLRVGLAFAACAAAALTRTQLAVLFPVLALALGFVAWESERGRRWRSTWGRWDWVGAFVLAVGVAVAFSALMGHVSTSWRETTGFYKDRIFGHAVSAMGALAIGFGVLPLVAGVSALARPRGERPDRQTHAFVVTAVTALAAFVWYAGIKGAYIENTFSNVVVERNVIYLTPLLFAGTALAIERGVGRWWAVAGAALATTYVVAETPLHLSEYPYYEAHGLSIAAFANREWHWPEGRIRDALVVACFVALAIVVAMRVLRRGSVAFRAVAGCAAAVVLAWSLTAEVYAAQAERHLSRQVAGNLATPYDWVDRATGGSSLVILGQGISDPTGLWLTEFFNRSVKKVWSLDGTAIKVGSPILTPDLDATDGTLAPSPETDYALAVNGVSLVAPVVDRRGSSVLYRLDGQPLRLQEALIGREGDGWIIAKNGETTATASYTRYDVTGDGAGFVVLKFSRLGWCPRPSERVPGIATVRIGPVGIGADKQPAIAQVTQVRTVVVKDCRITPLLLNPPDRPWRVEVSVSPTFTPHDVDPGSSERRALGAVFDAQFEPLFSP